MLRWVRTARALAGAMLCTMLVATLVLAMAPRARAPRSGTHSSLQIRVSGKHTERGGIALARAAGNSGWRPRPPWSILTEADDASGIAPAPLASFSPRAPPPSL